MKKILCVLAVMLGAAFNTLFSQDTIKYVWYDDFENLTTDSMSGTSVYKRWQPMCFFYIEASNSIVNTGDSHGRVWQSYYHQGKYAGGNDDGFSMEIPLGAQYDEIWFDNDLWADPGFDGTSPNGGYSGKIMSGLMGGTDVLKGGKDLQYWDLDSSATGNGWAAHGVWGSGDPNALRPYYFDQNADGQTHQMQIGENVPRGYWIHVTRRVKLNTPGKANGIFEVYINGKLVGQDTKVLWNSWAEAHNGLYPNGLGKIDAMLLCLFFGGAGEHYSSPRDNYIRLDNFCVYYYTPSAKGYLPGPAPAGHRIPIVSHSGHKYAPDLLVDEKFTSASGRIYSHKNTMVFSPYVNKGDVQEKEITRPDGPIKITFLKFYPGVNNYEGYNSWTKIYSGTGEGKTLLYTFDRDNYPSGTYTVDSPTATIEYYSGSNMSEGFIASYTSPGAELPPVAENNPPAISDQEFNIKENDFKGNYVGKLVAFDKDASQQLTYTIVSGNQSGVFKIDSKTGDLTTTTSDLFDFDLAVYNLGIKVTDNGTNALSATCTVVVKFIGNAKVVYIDPDNTGDASQDGSDSHPYASWTDVTWKDNSTYLQKRGTTAKETNIVIAANNVTLDAYGEGDFPVISSETDNYLISALQKSGVSIKNLHIKGLNSASCIYLLGSTGQNINIEHCVLEGNENSIRTIDCEKTNLKYNIISAENEGIYSTATENEIYYNVFKNSKSSVNIIGANAKAQIFNNVFINNETAVSASYAEITLYNNIFSLAQRSQKAIRYNADKLTSDHNIFYPEQDNFIEISNIQYSTLQQFQQQTNRETHSSNLNPQFVDPSNDNYSIDNYSPAIDAGINLNLGKDFYGQDVPYSGMPDIGIAEYNGHVRENSMVTPKLVIYPNPTTGYLNVDADLSQAGLDVPSEKSTSSAIQSEIKVLDMTGNLIFSRIFESGSAIIHENIDLSAFANGFYSIILRVAEKTIVEKLILAK